MSANKDTKKRLDDLKSMLESDPIDFNSDNHDAFDADFPTNSNNIKYIDYSEEKKNHKEFSEQVISNIITNYVKSEKLLASPRLKDLKQKDIMKYSQLLLLNNIAESNLIKIQESIDCGDMSKDMFTMVNQTQKELREIMTDIDKHLDKCEKYWEKFSEQYGLEIEEEKIVQETETKEDNTIKRTIIDMSKLSESVQLILAEQKEKEKKQREKED